MATTTYKILGQGVPTTTTSTALYTVGATSTQAIVSTVVICNVTSTPAAAYLYAVKGGSTAGTANALLYGGLIPANGTVTLTLGVTLGGGALDFIQCGSGTSGSLTFTVFGSETV